MHRDDVFTRHVVTTIFSYVIECIDKMNLLQSVQLHVLSSINTHSYLDFVKEYSDSL
jgi:hypothetical protein